VRHGYAGASETSDGILTLTLDRPDKKNALTDAMYGTLADAFEAAAADDAVRAVLITSSGDSFTAGNDLGDFMSIATGMPDERAHVWRFLDWLARFEKPLVAAVPGLAIGVGTTMLLHCDLVYLAEDAVLATPFVDLALVPEAASSLLLPARIGHVRAFALFALGERMTAAEALAAGLANRSCPATRSRRPPAPPPSRSPPDRRPRSGSPRR
jgi:enoyl-CoA hydratase/carnithine racemase